MHCMGVLTGFVTVKHEGVIENERVVVHWSKCALTFCNKTQTSFFKVYTIHLCVV